MNYSGTISNFTVINGQYSDEGLEVDGPEGSTYINGMFTLKDGNVYTFGGSDASSEFKSKAQGTLQNVRVGSIKIRASYQNECVDQKSDALTNLLSNILVFDSCETGPVNVYTNSTNSSSSGCVVLPSDQSSAESIIVSTPTLGSSTAMFNWTWLYLHSKI